VTDPDVLTLAQAAALARCSVRLAGGAMSRDQIIICTGSRTLADDPRAVTWARTILARELASATLVVAGDARGPDTWAHDIAQGMVKPIDCERWCVAGHVLRWNALPGRVGGWSFAGDWAEMDTLRDPRKRPLARNAAMVNLYGPPDRESTIRLVALIDPASRTQGTQHTVTLARAAGINVAMHVWGAV
jgi:hypothetical protein